MLVDNRITAFNRTIVELKPANKPRCATNMRTFNRTIVELKPNNVLTFAVTLYSFNRTIVELKLRIYESYSDGITLLIVLS